MHSTLRICIDFVGGQRRQRSAQALSRDKDLVIGSRVFRNKRQYPGPDRLRCHIVAARSTGGIDMRVEVGNPVCEYQRIGSSKGDD
jgi:hypothetical protein